MPKYINSGELLYDVYTESVEGRIYDGNTYVGTFNVVPIDDITEIVNHMPAADVVEVKHGKWIDGDGNYVPFYKEGVPKGSCDCSVCGRWLTASDEYDVYGNFCPYCGADMRERKEEEDG